MKIATIVIVRVINVKTGDVLSQEQGASSNVILPRPGDFIELDVIDSDKNAAEQVFVVESIGHKYNDSIRPIITIGVSDDV